MVYIPSLHMIQKWKQAKHHKPFWDKQWLFHNPKFICITASRYVAADRQKLIGNNLFDFSR